MGLKKVDWGKPRYVGGSLTRDICECLKVVSTGSFINGAKFVM